VNRLRFGRAIRLNWHLAKEIPSGLEIIQDLIFQIHIAGARFVYEGNTLGLGLVIFGGVTDIHYPSSRRSAIRHAVIA
jgi:hypothetical protein